MNIKELGASKYDALKLKKFFRANNKKSITKQFDPFPLTDETVNKILNDGEVYFVAYSKVRFMGFGMLRYQGYNIPSFGVFVDHRHKRKGVATKLLDYAIKSAKLNGAKKIRLSVYADNHAAIELYKKTGFEITDTLENGNRKKLVMHLCL